jgi:hypothetical protein
MAGHSMSISEAVVVYDGHGVTTQVSRLTATSITVCADVTLHAGEDVTVFIDGVGRIDSRVTYVSPVSPPHIHLSFLTDTQERWRQLQLLRLELA